MWDPTALPSGQQFSRAVYNLLFCSPGHTIPKDLIPSADAFASVPFEVVGEACPQPEVLKSLIRILYAGSSPNAIHLAIAQALGDGVIWSAVTPNYDCSLEKAAIKLGVSLSRITQEGDQAKTRWPQYFKIHGSADDSENSRLITFMRDEVRLPEWKEGILRRLVSDRPLIVIGYLGLDFELGPALLDTRPTRVVWLSRSGSLSPYCKRVLGAFHGTALIGDLVTLFHRLFGTPAKLKQGNENEVINDRLQEVIDDGAITVWAARLLNQLGYVKGAGYASRQKVEQEDYQHILEGEAAQALMSGGRYQRAARQWEALARKSAGAVSESDIGYAMQAADCWRLYGSWSKFFVCMLGSWLRSRKLRDPRLSAIMKYKILDFIAQGAEIATLLGVPSGLIPASRFLGRLWEEAEDGFLDAGGWMGVRIVGLLHVRLMRRGLLISNREPVIRPEEGFKHLAFEVGGLMAVRTRILMDRNGLNDRDRAYVVGQAKEAERLGIMTEAWKLRRVAGEPWTSEPLRRALAACEYSRWMRILHRWGLETKSLG